MLKPSDPNYDPETVSELYSILDEMLAPFDKKMRPPGKNLEGFFAPFDYTRPNQHDTKAGFLREYDIVKTVYETSDTMLRALIKSDVDEDTKTALDDIESIVDRKLMLLAPTAPVDTIADVIRRIVADTNGFVSSIWVVLDFHRAFKERLAELEEQKDKFWNVSHRAPDYYARAIASRLAKLYARETGEFPTSGTSPISGGASTRFTKALEKVFKLLDINCGVRSPADWAIKHLTEDDLKPPMYAMGSILGSGQTSERPKGLLTGLFEDPES